MSYFSLTPERADELIDKIAQFIVNSELATIAELMLGAYGATNTLGMVSFVAVYPWAVGIFGRAGRELTELLGLNPSENAKRILEKVRILEREKERQKQHEPSTNVKGTIHSFLNKIKARFSRQSNDLNAQ